MYVHKNKAFLLEEPLCYFANRSLLCKGNCGKAAVQRYVWKNVPNDCITSKMCTIPNACV